MSWNGTGLINGGQWDGASVIFAPTLTNNRPVVTPPSNITIEFANGGPGLAKSNATLQSWLATATAADFEDGALSVTADLSALPDPIQAGTYQIPFTATDSGGLDDTQTAQLIVAEAAAANPAPTSSGNYPQQSATVGVPFSFNGATTFSDPGDTLIFSATGLPSGLTINSNTGVVSGSASTAGGYTVVITATDSVGQQVTAQLPIVVVAAVSGFWQFTPKQDRILNMDASPLADQDKNASLNYWLNFGFVVSPLTISSFTIDPDNELPQDKPAITGAGVNTAELTDSDGNTYPVGTVVGITVSGGALEEVYHTVVRFVMNSGESDDRTLSIRIVDK